MKLNIVVLSRETEPEAKQSTLSSGTNWDLKCVLHVSAELQQAKTTKTQAALDQRFRTVLTI